MERMKELIKTLDEASRAYYEENRELMSNYAYDALYDELENLEQESGVRLSNSPTAKVGYEVVGTLTKVPHDTPMLSLDKTKDIEKLAAFLSSHVGLLSWKLDGLKVVLKYINGELTQAVTRGNGLIGEDVTHTARVFANLPLFIPYKGSITLQGEAVIAHADFERINETIPDPAEKYKNARNLCSGTIRQLNSEVAAERRVRFYAFGLTGYPLGELPPGDLRSHQLAWLAGQGFTVVAHRQVNVDTLADTVAAFQREIPNQDVSSDGLVLAFDDIAYSATLGATSKFPRDSLAFKWADETCETTLRYIEWNTSRTGLINPVAVFEPVDIEGSEVSRASLHNVSIVRGLALGDGDIITVYKANMIIPQVADNLTRSNTAVIPTHCPVCRTETEIVGLREGEALYCLNPNCKAQLVCALAHFAARDAMNIEGMSEQTLEKFTDAGLIVHYPDIFKLEQHGEAITAMEGFGAKSFSNLRAAIERAKDAALPNFIYALGIKHVGLSNAKLLCAQYAYDIESIINAARGEGYTDELLAIKGFGEVITRSLHIYFSDEGNLALLREALRYVRITRQEGTAEAKPLAGLTFVITGDVNRFENRQALQGFIERYGGRTTSSITAKTSYLINNDAASPSAKNKKAVELGVLVVTEDTFLIQFNLNPDE
jgi:DNA ligase (NAD+)